MAKAPYLSIVIPAYNEEINLNRGVLSSVNDYLSQQKYTWEVLVVDDGSTDNTKAIVEKFVKSHKRFKLMKEHHRGKGGTVVAGLKAAKGKYIVFTDMDQATPIKELNKMLPKFKEADVVIGSRAGREGATLIRKIMAYGFSLLRGIILRLPFKDTQCGFKGFKNKAAKNVIKHLLIFSGDGNYKSAAVTAGFDLELLYVTRKLKYKITEVEVEWWEYGERREVSPIKDSWEGLRDMLRIRINALAGNYKF